MLSLLTTTTHAFSQSPSQQCGNSSSYCPAELSCCAAQYSPSTFGCQVAGGTCCKMGPELPPSTTKKNELINGDSVSIGYTSYANPNVPALLSITALAQHAPWDVSDGGAGSTAQGLACVERYLVTQAQQPVKWDAITFNFGLHDLDNSSAAEALYSSQLFNITTRLLATGAKLLYLTTTPFMPKRMLGDTVVEQLNVKARAIMDAHAIPVLDLYALVVAHCGPVPYADCDWCRRHPCSYHYDAAGMDAQAIAVANAVEGLLSER